MSLPLPWVDSLFGRLAVRYGAAWSRMWDGVDVALVKADWAAELSGLQLHPASIAYGLDHLPPDRPPTVGQFRALCIARPEKHEALPAPAADPAVAAAALASMTKPTGHDPKAWARELRRQETSLVRLTSAQRSMWRAALAGEEVEA
jgi:hypothetical protein